MGAKDGDLTKAGCLALLLVNTLVPAHSASILAVAVLGVTALASSSSRLTKTMEEKDAALRAIDAMVREIEALPLNQIPAYDGRGFGATLNDATANMLTPVAGDADGLPGSVQVVVPNPPNDGSSLLQVVVQVDWRGSSGNQTVVRSVLLSRVGQG